MPLEQEWVTTFTAAGRLAAILPADVIAYRAAETLNRMLHVPVPEQGHWLGQVVRGCLAYHAGPTNARAA